MCMYNVCLDTLTCMCVLYICSNLYTRLVLQMLSLRDEECLTVATGVSANLLLAFSPSREVHVHVYTNLQKTYKTTHLGMR